jgi:hypothetical protein
MLYVPKRNHWGHNHYQPKREGTIKDGTFEFCASGSANAD